MSDLGITCLYLSIGVALQAGTFYFARLCDRLLYSIGWLPTLVIGVPMFVSGILFVWGSGAWWPLRMVLGGWPLAVPTCIIGRYFLERRHLRRDVILVPAGYTGRVTVEFEVADGAEAEYENGSRLFRVGPDGTLRTRAGCRWFASRSLNVDRWQRRRIFIADAGGARTDVTPPNRFSLDGLPEDRVIVSPGGEHCDEKDRRVVKLVFDVGTVAQVRRWLGLAT
jgi:hypothetical protein